MIRDVLGIIRLPFLILAPACVLVGVAMAHWEGHALSGLNVALVILGAVMAHISVNAFNEYFDCRSGLDKLTERTAFSGGSGTLPGRPELMKLALAISVGSLAGTALIGLYFVWLHGWQLLPLGIFGLVLVVTYTIWWVNNPLMCLIAPGLGFGVLMVMGAHFALTGQYSVSSFVASLPLTCMTSNLLLLNQFPDVEADKQVGRRHFPIAFGRQASVRLYGVLLLVCYGSIAAGVAGGWLPPATLVTLVTALIGWRIYRFAGQHADDIPALIPSMGLNVVINLLMPLLLAAGLFFG